MNIGHSMKCQSVFIFLFSVVVFGSIMVSCSREGESENLMQINEVADKDPMQAMSMLDSLDCKDLSIADRHLYDLLSIKTRDKAYIKHSSDSLIQDVMNWYNGHKDDKFYAEALYYGGRVYTDIGDYPVALKCFQSAIDALPDEKNPELKKRVLSQSGRLLNNMCLYSEAIPYLEECLRVSALIGDSAVSSYDLQLLGNAYMRIGKYDKADEYYQKGYERCKKSDVQEKAYMRGNIAVNQYYKGDIDLALSLIRDVPGNVNKTVSPYFSSYAARIYLEKGMPDSAYKYALDIVRSENPRNQTMGYLLLFKPELIGMTPRDSVTEYIARYQKALVERDNKSENNAVMIQNSLYNYSLHEREAAKSIKAKNRLMTILYIVSVLLLILFASLVFVKYTSNQKQVKLQQALLNIRQLKSQLENREGNNESLSHPMANIGLQDEIACEIQQLKRMVEDVKSRQLAPIETEGKAVVDQWISEGKVLDESDECWEQVRTYVSSIAPDFEMSIRKMSRNTLSKQEMHVAMLIRLGMQSNRIADLIGRSKGAITYNRKQLCQKLFAGQIDLVELDHVIRLL